MNQIPNIEYDIEPLIKDFDQFIHFDTFKECDDFIDLLKSFDINITHKCCGGKGCGIKNINFIHVKNIYNSFKPQYKRYESIMCENEILECGICFQNVQELIIKCHTGCHPYCINCWDNLKKSECPTCRGKLL